MIVLKNINNLYTYFWHHLTFDYVKQQKQIFKDKFSIQKGLQTKKKYTKNSSHTLRIKQKWCWIVSHSASHLFI